MDESKKYYQNYKCPKGDEGKELLGHMNEEHRRQRQWGLSQIDLSQYSYILDVGCGGGSHILHMLEASPESVVDGIDYSAESVIYSQELNKVYIGKRSTILEADVAKLPFEDERYDLVTAFETIYFWPSLDTAFKEIRRVLKGGGTFLIECGTDDVNNTEWTDQIDGMVIYSGEMIREQLEESGFDFSNLKNSRLEKQIGLARNI